MFQSAADKQLYSEECMRLNLIDLLNDQEF